MAARSTSKTSSDTDTPTAAPTEAPAVDTDTTPEDPALTAAPSRPATQGVAPTSKTVEYINDEGQAVNPDDVFDLSGRNTLVVAKTRVYERFQPAGMTTKLTRLAFATGQEVPRAKAQAFANAAK